MLLILLSIVEVFWIGNTHGLDPISNKSILMGNLLQSFQWGLYTVGIFFIIQMLIGLLLPKVSYFIYKLILSLLILGQISLIFYFSETLVPLGADFFTYSFEDLIETVQAAGALNIYSVFASIFALVLIFLSLSAGRFIKFNFKTTIVFSVFTYAFLLVLLIIPIDKSGGLSGLESNLAENKSLFFYQESYDYFSKSQNIYFDFYLENSSSQRGLVQKEYIDPSYPFLHINNYPDVLGPYFSEFDTIPDLVFIIVEGLGKAYSGPGAYLGSWTPFLDSLADHSLYWKNNLSTTGRTFGVLSGIFGGLPFGRNGFMEKTPVPYHSTMLSLLKKDGYQINYYIGADKEFDNAATFMNYQGVDNLVDIDKFDPEFSKSPSVSGFSWGYADKENFRNGLKKLPNTDQAQVNIFQTMSSHSPFVIPEQDFYNKKFEKFLNEKGYSHPTIKLENYKAELASVLYVDDAIKEFFKAYLKREKATNTIFIITGDHRLPEIPMSTKIDRFHVPLIIYSPKLERDKYMDAVNTHFEIAPSLLAFLQHNYDLKLPETVAWRGAVLDTAAQFESKITHALMRNKYQFGDYLDGNYFISDKDLYVLSDNMNIDLVDKPEVFSRLQNSFEEYKAKDNFAMENNAILPQ
ncbi:LTA synthase family protein [Echinicola sp. 20G]|uniref:LTA synthase family protein n=1 Tax=Echinicola sp. 20G TaxID=2781961 RepID=UPI001F3AD2ED|nr:LTA synthase family protein [Echinicola sp. 20G]